MYTCLKKSGPLKKKQKEKTKKEKNRADTHISCDYSETKKASEDKFINFNATKIHFKHAIVRKRLVLKVLGLNAQKLTFQFTFKIYFPK